MTVRTAHEMQEEGCSAKAGEGKSCGAIKESRATTVAEHVLSNCGYEILEHGWACEMGEADMIAADGNTLMIANVRYKAEGDTLPTMRKEGSVGFGGFEYVAERYLELHGEMKGMKTCFADVSILELDDGTCFVRVNRRWWTDEQGVRHSKG